MPKLEFSFKQKPEDAIKYFVQKGNAPSWNWYEVWQEAHAQYFTVAKVMKLDILQDIRRMVQKSLEDGITFHQFQKELEPKLRNHGWWGKDKGTGAQLGSPYRLRTIFSNNLNAAYAAGRYKKMRENAENRPWWRYWTVGDSRVRKSHAKLHGKVFHHTDPFWDYFFGPNDWGCRCKAQALSDKDLGRLGITPEKTDNNLTTADRLVSKKSDVKKPVGVYTDPITGEKTETAPGWSYNVGKTAWEPPLEKYPNDLRQIFRDDGYFDVNSKFAKEIERKMKQIAKELEQWKGLKCRAEGYVFDLPIDKFHEETKGRKSRGFWREKDKKIHLRNDIAMGLISEDKKRKNSAKRVATHETIHATKEHKLLAYADPEKWSKDKEKERKRCKDINEGITELLTTSLLMETQEIDPKPYRKQCAAILKYYFEKGIFDRDVIEDEILKAHTDKGKFPGKWAKDIEFPEDIEYEKFLPELIKNGIIRKDKVDKKKNKPEYIQREMKLWFSKKQKNKKN